MNGGYVQCLYIVFRLVVVIFRRYTMALSDWSSAIGGIASSGISALSSALNSSKAYKYAVRLANHQYRLQQRGYNEGPTNARQGLEKAGYNPILALSTGGQFAGAGSSVPVNSNPVDTSGIETGVSNALQYGLNKQTVANQTNETNARVGLMNEQAITEQAKRLQMEFQNAMTDVETHLKQKDLDSYERRFYAEIYELMQRAENYKAMQSIASYNAMTDRQNAFTNAINAETNRGSLELEKTNKPWKTAATVAGGIAGLGTMLMLKKPINIAKNVANARHVVRTQKSINNLHTFGRHFGTKIHR